MKNIWKYILISIAILSIGIFVYLNILENRRTDYDSSLYYIDEYCLVDYNTFDVFAKYNGHDIFYLNKIEGKFNGNICNTIPENIKITEIKETFSVEDTVYYYVYMFDRDSCYAEFEVVDSIDTRNINQIINKKTIGFLEMVEDVMNEKSNEEIEKFEIVLMDDGKLYCLFGEDTYIEIK